MPHLTTDDNVELYYEEVGSAQHPSCSCTSLPATTVVGAADALFFPTLSLHSL